MDKPFNLVIPVEQVNLSGKATRLDAINVRVTLRHTLAHVRHLIWMFSEGNLIKPMFILFRYNNGIIADSLPLSEIFSVEHSLEITAAHGLSVIIDYTLFESPTIPKREPVPDLFDVEIVPEEISNTLFTQTCFTRESLLSSVASVLELAAMKHKIAPEKLQLTYGGVVYSESLLLREILALDVPPLTTVRFGVRMKPVKYPIKVQTKQPLEQVTMFVVYVEKNVLIRELKAEIAAKTGLSADMLELYVRAHCFSKASGLGDLARLLEIVSLQEEIENAPEILYAPVSRTDGAKEVPKTGLNKSMIIERDNIVAPEASLDLESDHISALHNSNLPSETYEIEIAGKSVLLSTSECILDPDGQLLLNAEARAKVANLGVILDSKRAYEANRPSSVTNMRPILAASFPYRPSAVPPAETAPEPTSQASFPQPQPTATANDLISESTLSQEPAMTRITQDIVDEINHTTTNRATGPETAAPVPNPASQNTEAEPVPEPANFPENAARIEREPRENVLNRPQGNNGTVLRAIFRVLSANWVTIVQRLAQIGITMFLMGGNILLELFEPTILTVLAFTCLIIAFFLFGIEISDWIDSNVLAHGNPDLLDHIILKYISLIFRLATLLNERICIAVSMQCIKVAAKLHQTRLERLENEIFGNPFWTPLKQMSLQVLEALFLGLVTIFPFLEHDLRVFFDVLDRLEGQDLKKTIHMGLIQLGKSDNLENIKALIQAQLRVPIEALLDIDATPGLSHVPQPRINEEEGETEEDQEANEETMGRAREEENEDLLRCYLLLRWFDTHKNAKEIPPRLRRV
ncbi:hypothetical protein HF325_001218 [Metschnikowia pulcherrima]|uniref:Uncharacterized protein n=1 Tax=Metschnikowia pulcherrima TaxID=27326 RepID=A0A8H7GU44_9ASCO|nr:hypothetical protein HF325_001218 [Metschnikowia pulcherrima]